MTKVDCPSENELLARVSGALSAERAETIDAHIDGCADCRVLLAEATLWQDEPQGRSNVAATFAVGETVANRYAVTRWLATGGMGEVYEVHDTCLDEPVALKTVVATIADDPLALTRLKAEVRLARRVTHKNVCRVYDLGLHQRGGEQIAFLTMELLRGTTLRSRLRDVGRLELDAALPLIAQMVAALSHAHAAGIVHRDFKSDNVMLVPSANGAPERLVVMDFGLARQALAGGAQPLTPHSRAVFGTLDYMSPEQVMGKPASPASDIYSLGVVSYELLSGRLPFEGDSPLARAVLRVTQKAPPLVDVLPGVEPAVNACIAKCLETKGDRRFATVDDVLRALRGEPALARAARFGGRRAVASVALSFALGGGLALLAGSGRQQPATRRPTAAAMRSPAPPKAPLPSAQNAVASPSEVEPVSPEVMPVVSGAPSGSPTRSLARRPAIRAPARRAAAAHGPPEGGVHAAPAEPQSSPPQRASPPVPTGDALMNPFADPPAVDTVRPRP